MAAAERRAAQRRTAKAVKAGENPIAGYGKAARRKAATYIHPKTSSWGMAQGEQVHSPTPIQMGDVPSAQERIKSGPVTLSPSAEPVIPHLLSGVGSGSLKRNPPVASANMGPARAIGQQFAGLGAENRGEQLVQQRIGHQISDMGMKSGGPAYPNFPGMLGQVHSQPQRPSLPGATSLGKMEYSNKPSWEQEPTQPAEQGQRVKTSPKNGTPAPVMESKQLGGKKTANLTITDAMRLGHLNHTRMHRNGTKISDYLAKATASPLPDKGVTI